MSGINERVQIFLRNIGNYNNEETNLQDLRVALTSLNSRELTNIAQSSQLNALFDCLNSSNKSQILSACEVLKILLPALPISLLISRYLPSMIRALGHPQTEVKVVILEQLIMAATSELLVNGVDHNSAFLSSVGNCLCHEDVSVGQRAVDFFIALGKTKNGLVALCQPAFIRELIQNVGENNVYVLRIFDVLVEISSDSDDALKYLESEGLLDRVSTFLRTDDVLAMLSLVEVCTKLAITSHGWDFLKRHGVFKHLAEQLISYEDDPLSNLKYPGLSRFFGQVAKNYPSVLNDYDEILRCVFKAIDSDNLNIFIPSLELIGMIAYTPEGKLVLQKQDEKYVRHAMGRIAVAIVKLPVEWRLRALHTLANVMHVETDMITPEILRVNETWFNQLGRAAFLSLVEMALQPFSDVKTAALSVFLSIANQKWGVCKITECSDLLEFLLNRRAETESQGLLMKYNILKTIIESNPNPLDYIFSVHAFERIVQYVQEGPFYAPSTTEVAVEDAE